MWRAVEGMWRAVEGCGGLWRAVEGCGGPWRAVEGCGGLWRAVEGCGGVWRGCGGDVEGCGGLWRAVEGMWRAVEGCGGLWRAVEGCGGLWRGCGGVWRGCGGLWRAAEGCGGLWRDVEGCGGLWRGVEGMWRGCGGLWRGCGGLWRAVEGCGGLWRAVEGCEGCGGLWRAVEGCGGLWRGCGGLLRGCGGVWRAVEGCGGLWRAVEGCGALWRAVEGCGGLWRAVEGMWSAVEGCGGLWRAVEGCGELWSAVEGCGGLWRAVGRCCQVRFTTVECRGCAVSERTLTRPAPAPLPPPQAGMFGKGIYFATDPRKSCHFAPTGELMMCRVALGRTTIMGTADRELTGDSLRARGYDSVTAPGSRWLSCCFAVNRTEYAIFDPDMAYPEYLIKFTRLSEQRPFRSRLVGGSLLYKVQAAYRPLWAVLFLTLLGAVLYVFAVGVTLLITTPEFCSSGTSNRSWRLQRTLILTLAVVLELVPLSFCVCARGVRPIQTHFGVRATRGTSEASEASAPLTESVSSSDASSSTGRPPRVRRALHEAPLAVLRHLRLWLVCWHVLIVVVCLAVFYVNQVLPPESIKALPQPRAKPQSDGPDGFSRFLSSRSLQGSNALPLGVADVPTWSCLVRSVPVAFDGAQTCGAGWCASNPPPPYGNPVFPVQPRTVARTLGSQNHSTEIGNIRHPFVSFSCPPLCS